MSAFDREVELVRPSTIVVAHAESVRLVPRTLVRRERVVVDFHNVGWRWQMRAGRRLRAAKELVRESVTLRFCAAAVASSADEAAALRRLSRTTRTMVVPQGVDPSEWPDPPPEPPGPLRYAFFGSLWYGVNVDGVEWFLREVWPRVLAAEPRSEFILFGPGDGERFERLAPRVRVGGWQPKLASALHECHAIVVPIRAGPGTPMKFPEALASGRAVVTTSAGSVGMRAPGAFLSADDASDFAHHCLSLRNPEVRSAIGERGRAIALKTRTWRVAAEPLADYIRSCEASP
jgi:glycosyltransferase involved in cell wall biosynthesis